jgi:four helix bundle protein
LRAWQACCAYKKAVYVTCAHGPLAQDWARRRQIEAYVAGPPAHLAEGFGRFSAGEFARYAAIARASLIESQNHLRDAVDRGHLAEVARLELDVLAEAALREVTGLMSYLQSAEASEKSRRARERNLARRQRRDEPRT